MKAAYGLILASAAVLAGNTSARADVAVTFDPPMSTLNNNNYSLGFLFTVNSAINVTELGYFDENGDGFNTSHDVGIYQTDGTLLASTTVTTGDTLDGLFRYHAISPLALVAGQQYVIAGTTGRLDNYAWNGTNFSTAPEITYVENRFILSSVLAYASSNQENLVHGWFGPNFKFEPGEHVVPEPSAIISAAIASVVGLGVARRRRRSA